jgi:hypothetical protein
LKNELFLNDSLLSPDNVGESFSIPNKEVPDSHKKSLPPSKRGGRPRAPTEAQEKPLAQRTESRSPRPEIVCWKEGRQWMAAVEIPEEFLEKSGLAVFQDGSPLTREGSRETCWPLERVLGEVVVQWNEGEAVQETRVVPGRDDYLLFKLSGQEQNQGRHVKSPSSGSYLVMAPDHWERDDTLSGPPPVTPESVFLHGYQAHFFELEKDGDRKIAFRTPTGDSFAIESKAPQFELVGNRLCDATEKIGPLFGERPPQIRARDNQTWKDVGTIVVGEEGSGRDRWRKAFHPEQCIIEQDLPSEVANRKGDGIFSDFTTRTMILLRAWTLDSYTPSKRSGYLSHLPFPLKMGIGRCASSFSTSPVVPYNR